MTLLIAPDDGAEAPDVPPVRRRWPSPRGALRWMARGVGPAAEWLFGVASILLGLSILAALPLAQFLSLGYMLEASGRVARTGRLRDGFIGVGRAARVGGVVAGTWLATWPAWLVESFAGSAALIDPGGPIALRWRAAAIAAILLTLIHVFAACARGGRIRHFVWFPGTLIWLARRMRRGGLYAEARDGLWEFSASLRLPHYFRVGLVGFLGALAWIIPPALLITIGAKAPPVGLVGALMLAVVVPLLPFLQVHYVVEGRASALFAPRAVRDHFRRAPWAFAASLMVMLLAAIPLYLLKIEMVPREAAWLPSLVFVLFLAPARLLTGWAYARSTRRDRPRHWFFLGLGRLAIVPVALVYVLAVFFSQYISWAGVGSLYEQHAFLLPVPFLNM